MVARFWVLAWIHLLFYNWSEGSDLKNVHGQFVALLRLLKLLIIFILCCK